MEVDEDETASKTSGRSEKDANTSLALHINESPGKGCTRLPVIHEGEVSPEPLSNRLLSLNEQWQAQKQLSDPISHSSLESSTLLEKKKYDGDKKLPASSSRTIRTTTAQSRLKSHPNPTNAAKSSSSRKTNRRRTSDIPPPRITNSDRRKSLNTREQKPINKNGLSVAKKNIKAAASGKTGTVSQVSQARIQARNSTKLISETLKSKSQPKMNSKAAKKEIHGEDLLSPSSASSNISVFDRLYNLSKKPKKKEVEEKRKNIPRNINLLSPSSTPSKNSVFDRLYNLSKKTQKKEEKTADVQKKAGKSAHALSKTHVIKQKVIRKSVGERSEVSALSAGENSLRDSAFEGVFDRSSEAQSPQRPPQVIRAHSLSDEFIAPENYLDDVKKRLHSDETPKKHKESPEKLVGIISSPTTYQRLGYVPIFHKQGCWKKQNADREIELVYDRLYAGSEELSRRRSEEVILDVKPKPGEKILLSPPRPIHDILSKYREKDDQITKGKSFLEKKKMLAMKKVSAHKSKTKFALRPGITKIL